MTGNSILIIISILILILSAHILYKKIENQILHLSPPPQIEFYLKLHLFFKLLIIF